MRSPIRARMPELPALRGLVERAPQLQGRLGHVGSQFRDPVERAGRGAPEPPVVGDEALEVVVVEVVALPAPRA